MANALLDPRAHRHVALYVKLPIKVSAEGKSQGISRTDGALQGAKMPLIFDSRKLLGFTGEEWKIKVAAAQFEWQAKNAEVIDYYEDQNPSLRLYRLVCL